MWPHQLSLRESIWGLRDYVDAQYLEIFCGSTLEKKFVECNVDSSSQQDLPTLILGL